MNAAAWRGGSTGPASRSAGARRRSWRRAPNIWSTASSKSSSAAVCRAASCMPACGPRRPIRTAGRSRARASAIAVRRRYRRRSREDGTWLNFVIPLPDDHLWRPHPYWPLGVGLVVVVVLCVVLVRHAVRPLNVLAKAADRLGRDVLAPPVEIRGPREVMTAANAFNRMQARLRRFIEDRTQMIAAISHDLRTPITRLKLRAEFIEDDEQRLKILADLDEMEAMISSTLAFARDDSARETKVPVDLVGVLVDLCDQFQAAYDGPDQLDVTIGANGIKRAFANLIENACKYGGGGRVALRIDGDMVAVTIEDDGPGIPVAELENVFAPFYRVESSRNRETGGTGLGLAVARSAIRGNGGDVTLANRTGGGLTVTVTLPL